LLILGLSIQLAGKMALGFISQAVGALGKNTNIKIWGLEGIGGRHDRKTAINLVE